MQGTVVVAGQTKELEITADEFDRLWINEPVAFKHRTGTKTYTISHVQVARRRDGKYAPVPTQVLRKIASPCSWGQGTTERVYY